MITLRQLVTIIAVVFISCVLVSAESSKKASITEIALERGCPGCPTSSLLVLRIDGTATLTTQGNERFGTSNQVSKGTVTAQQFSQLAGVIQAKGFFTMKEEYGDPNLQDAPWATLTVTCDGSTRKVMTRGESTPPNLQAILEAVDAVSKTAFRSVQPKR